MSAMGAGVGEPRGKPDGGRWTWVTVGGIRGRTSNRIIPQFKMRPRELPRMEKAGPRVLWDQNVAATTIKA